MQFDHGSIPLATQYLYFETEILKYSNGLFQIPKAGQASITHTQQVMGYLKLCEIESTLTMDNSNRYIIYRFNSKRDKFTYIFKKNVYKPSSLCVICFVV
jgi:hypothetical protein